MSSPIVLPHGSERSLGLDLMRAVAIAMVLTCHWSNTFFYWLGGKAPDLLLYSGELGVDLFFGLSGFLIGAILIEQGLADPSPKNLGVFLVRRWMRTLPLYFVILAVLLAFAPPAHEVGRTALMFATMTQNLFGPMPDWFHVTWSLAVEEWFYLLFGTAAFVCLRLVRRSWAIWIPIVAFVAVPLALRIGFVLETTWTNDASKTLVYRLDAIAYGVAMAQLYRQRSLLFEHPRIAFACGLAVIAVAMGGALPAPRIYPATLYAYYIFGCVLMIPAALKLRTAPAWIARPIQAMSAWSYCLYLVHLPVMLNVAQVLFARQLAPVWVCIAVTVIVPFVLAWLSFRFLEAPILKLRPRHGGRRDDPAPVAAVEAALKA